jgi:hypothetical protein
MRIYLFLFLLFVLFVFYKQKEPFTIHVDSHNIFETVHKYTVLPIYRRILYVVPFKHHYRKANRYFKSS